MTAALEGGEWSAARPGRTLPPGKTRYPLYRRLGGPQGRSGQAKNLVPTGIRSPDRPDRSSVATPTELPGPQTHIYNWIFVLFPVSCTFRRSLCHPHEELLLVLQTTLCCVAVTMVELQSVWYNIYRFLTELFTVTEKILAHCCGLQVL